MSLVCCTTMHHLCYVLCQLLIQEMALEYIINSDLFDRGTSYIMLPPEFDQDRYGPRLSSGPVWIEQGRGDCGSRQETMSFWLSIFLRDKISFYI